MRANAPRADAARSSRSLPYSAQRPLRVLTEQRVVLLGVPLGERRVLCPADVAERDERVPAQVARVLLRDVEPLVAADELVAVRLQPVDERHRRLDRQDV